MATMEEYAATRASYERAAQTLDEYAEAISTVSGHIKQSPYFSFANTSVGLPMEYLSGPSYDANQFPTDTSIQQATAAKDAAQWAMTNAWGSLSAEMRPALQPPPGVRR